MSIPPLVCSSPPPPEQCEDDKGPEDYDFQYNSQPDDDDDSASYNFDNYCSHTIYKTQTESIQDLKLGENLNMVIENISPSSPGSEPKTNNSAPALSDDSERNSDLQEDCVLEDLNLELTADIQMSTDDKNIEKTITKEDDSNMLNIQDAGGTDDNDNVQIKSVSQESSENDDLNILDNSSGDISFNDNDDNNLDEVLPIDVKEEIEKVNEEIKATSSQFVSDAVETVDEDDFGDFDSFQFTNPDTKTQSKSIINVENPWDSNTNSQGFGDFTANFDDSEPLAMEVTKNEVTENTGNSKNVTENTGSIDDDDDFGDFDDFKSSENPETASVPEDIMPHTSVLDFPTSDNEVQIMENINKVLATIFTEEVSEPSETADANIDNSLGEIWGHLVDTDIRQPYMVNWNNTLGQKSLLKALCIDSRNILFGTRWNYNMPKFAANLSASPLQPQKPVQSNLENPEPADKDNTWVDPFTPHGQESCSPESETPAAEVKSNVLEGFSGEIPASSSKIYSSALSVQPIRQINLPDTHIFTPTDSETPRSKTIHYDHTRTLAGFDAEVPSQKLETTHITGPEKDDYWDFQHFKGDAASALGEPKHTPEVVKDSSDKTFGTQILQPIRMEPIMPTLNWPDPGEVKETFMDFSDFVSGTVNNDTQDLKSSDSKVPVQSVNEIKQEERSVENDDDFETFQSAPPSNHSVGFENIPENFSSPISSIELLTQLESKSDASINSKPNEIPSSIDSVFKSETNHRGFSSQILAPFPSQVPVLQPSPVNRSQQSSGQILQPLSLEGFSQINWPNPGIDLHDLSKFNPIESVHSLKSDSSSGQSKVSTPVHSASARSEPDDDWGDFVSSAPKAATPKKTATFSDDDEWTDFVSSTSVKPPNGLNTISFNVQTNLNLQKSNQIKYPNKNSQINLDIPTLNYITPKTASRGVYADKHFQNL